MTNVVLWITRKAFFTLPTADLIPIRIWRHIRTEEHTDGETVKYIYAIIDVTTWRRLLEEEEELPMRTI
jgi:hypothetical protein